MLIVPSTEKLLRQVSIDWSLKNSRYMGSDVSELVQVVRQQNLGHPLSVINSDLPGRMRKPTENLFDLIIRNSHFVGPIFSWDPQFLGIQICWDLNIYSSQLF